MGWNVRQYKGLIVKLQNTKQERVADKYEQRCKIVMARNITSYLHCPNVSEERARYDDHSRECASSTVTAMYEGWNFNSGNYLFTTDTK